jgi:carbonic anhydrase
MSIREAGRKLTRRRVLQVLAFGTAAGGWAASRSAVASTGAAWSYGGADGPAHWGRLSSAYKTCSLGKHQSPIDLGAAHLAQGGDLILHWQPFAATVSHTGHTIEVAPVNANAAGSFLELGGQRYRFQQFHFHHPSEHALAGNRWPLEVHFVHQAVTGHDLAVVSVLFRPGRANDALEQVFSRMPSKPGTVALKSAMDMSQLLPRSAVTYRYAGSLTTPPCSENVNWVVFRDPIEASVGQIDSFARWFPMNARPVQPLANRSVTVDLF